MSHLPPASRRLRVLLAVVLAAVGLLGSAAAAVAQDGADAGPTVEILPVRGYLDPPVARAIEDVLTGAAERSSQLVILQLDSSGGLGVDADALVAAVTGSQVPVAVYVGPRVGRAGASGLAYLLLAAAQVNGVAADVTLGPATPVDLAVDDPVADQRLWDLAAAARALPAGLAQVAVAPDEIAGSDLAPVLEPGLVDLVANDLQGFLLELDGREVRLGDGTTTTLALPSDGVNVRFHSLGLVRRALHASATPGLVYFLLVAALGMLLFEWFQPGFGVAGFAGLIVLPIALYGLWVMPVTWWALVLLVAGMGLLALDVAIAGLGVPTIAGTVALVVGSLNLYASPFLSVPGWLVAVTVLAAVGFFTFVITIVLRAQQGPALEGGVDLVGKRGVVRSVLNPEGHVFVDGALWRGRWTGDDRRVGVGTVVDVTGVDGPLLLVGPEGAAEAAPDVADTDDGATAEV